MATPATHPRSVALVTLGCTRNEVDSEELAGRLTAEGWTLLDDAALADVAVVNTCGFIEQAKKDSIDALLEAADLKETGRTRAVVAVGCLAERYGQTLADELPDADAVLGFDSYAHLSDHLRSILAGERVASHVPSDRRRLLPLSPIERGAVAAVTDGPALPGHTTRDAGEVVRARLDNRVWAPLKIASGCDRRCAFCAIPMFRGAFVSRRPHDVLAEAAWLAGTGVREVLLVSENSTSYGKDLGDLALLEKLLPELAAVAGMERVRVSYLQPAEVRPGLLDVLAGTPGVAPYFDLSFQHASPTLLRRMRRFGGREDFLRLVEDIRRRAPLAGIRTNVILGFPGETEADVEELADFLLSAQLDVVGVFGYSDEDGTEAEGLPDHLDAAEVFARVEQISSLVEELTSQRAEDRIGEQVRVLLEEFDEDEGAWRGRALHQGPEVDGTTLVAPSAVVGDDADRMPPAEVGSRHTAASAGGWEAGRTIEALVTGSAGVDLLAEPVGES